MQESHFRPDFVGSGHALGVMMRPLLSVALGFGGALVAAVLIGFFIGFAFPDANGAPAFYAAEFAGIVVSLTVWFFAGRWAYRHLRRKDPPLAGHPA